MATTYRLQKDVQGYNGFGLAFSDTKFTATLTQNADTTLTVPSTTTLGTPVSTTNNVWLAVVSVSAGDEVWVANNATAAVPAGATFASSTSELVVGGQFYARQVNGGDVMHFITAGTTTSVSVSFYALPAN